MLALYVEAPFAACRTFTAGWYRPTAAFLTPSAAYGLLLNLAGVDTRLREEDERHPGSVPATLTRPGLPRVRLALGAATARRCGGRSAAVAEPDRYPRVATTFQQIHNYPVGDSAAKGQERPSVAGFARAKGAKYNISPVRREVLVGMRAVIAIDGNAELEAGIRAGLAGQPTPGRYGLPFLGDNAFLPDRIDPLETIPPAHWYERIGSTAEGVRPRATRLTVWIDRSDLSKTVSHLFAPSGTPGDHVPPTAWVELPPNPSG